MAEVKWDGGWNTWTVESGTYYGLADLNKTAWVVEFAGDRANADRIARNAAKIDEIIGVRHVRLTVIFDGDTMTIANYDNDQIIAKNVPAVA